MLTIIIASVLIALIFAPLGCLSLWKRYIYFGDGLAHASLLAGSISIILTIPVVYSGIIIALVFAFVVFKFKDDSGSNAAINLISSFMLAIALVIAVASPSQININQLLFGDIVSVSTSDLVILVTLLFVVYISIILSYQKIIIIVLNKDIARIRGINVKRIELLFLILLSITVFSTVKIVGSLLVTSILLIPALVAKTCSRTPSNMIIMSVIIAVFCNLLGLMISFYWNVPVAPITVIIQSIIYFIANASIRKL